jgi:hypothetical protein
MVLVPSPAMTGRGTVLLRVFESRPGFDAAVLAGEARLAINEPSGQPVVHRFEAPTRAGQVYGLVGRVLEGEVLLTSVDIQARRHPPG